jgi:cytochrome c-type biogenesis protein
VAGAVLFVVTFSAIFIILGLSATALGGLLFQNQLTLRKVAGVVILLLGVLFVASIFVPRLNRDARPAGLLERAGTGGPVIAGAAFALAWTPCVGPTLGAILGLASTQQSTLEGAGLLAVYSAGLAVPFLFAAVAFDAAQRSFGWLKRHYAAVQAAAGVLLIGMGVLVLTGTLFRLNIVVQQGLERLGLNFFQSV